MGYTPITFLDYRPAYEGQNSRGQWVNPYTGKASPNLTEFQKECEAQGLEKVKSACLSIKDQQIVSDNIEHEYKHIKLIKEYFKLVEQRYRAGIK